MDEVNSETIDEWKIEKMQLFVAQTNIYIVAIQSNSHSQDMFTLLPQTQKKKYLWEQVIALLYAHENAKPWGLGPFQSRIKPNLVLWKPAANTINK